MTWCNMKRQTNRFPTTVFLQFEITIHCKLVVGSYCLLNSKLSESSLSHVRHDEMVIVCSRVFFFCHTTRTTKKGGLLWKQVNCVPPSLQRAQISRTQVVQHWIALKIMGLSASLCCSTPLKRLHLWAARDGVCLKLANVIVFNCFFVPFYSLESTWQLTIILPLRLCFT